MATYHLKLKTLSPVFIGGKQGNDLNRWKFFKYANNIYVIDELKLATALKETNKIEEFCNFVNKNSQDGLQQFLYINNWFGKEKSGLAKYFFNSDNANFPSSSSVKTCIKDAFLIPYIPGSSIKGFVRTAILYDFLDNIKNANNDKFVNLVGESLRDATNKKADDKIIADTISALAKGTGENEEQSYWDILKTIKISDAYAEDKNISNIIKGCNAKVFESHYIPIALEGIKEGVELTFNIQIDNFIIKQFKDRLNRIRENIGNEVIRDYLDKIDEKFKLANLLGICKKFASKIIDEEKTYASSRGYTKIKTFYNNIENNPIRIGYGSGLLSTTIYLLMNPEQIETVRADFFRWHTEMNRFPKTRRYIVDDRETPYLPFGWGSIEEVRNERQ